MVFKLAQIIRQERSESALFLVDDRVFMQYLIDDKVDISGKRVGRIEPDAFLEFTNITALRLNNNMLRSLDLRRSAILLSILLI